MHDKRKAAEGKIISNSKNPNDTKALESCNARGQPFAWAKEKAVDSLIETIGIIYHLDFNMDVKK